MIAMPGLLSRIANREAEFLVLCEDHPDEMVRVLDVCQVRFDAATFGLERPTRIRDIVALRRTIAEQAFETARERKLLRGANKTKFGWETLLWWVIMWIVRQLIEDWLMS